MKRLLALLALGGLLLGMTGAAQAEALPWKGTLELLLFDVYGDIASWKATASGVDGIVNGSGGLGQLTTVTLRQTGLAGSGSVSLPTSLNPIVGIEADFGLGTGTLIESTSRPWVLTGSVPLTGEIRFCLLFPNCSSVIQVPLTIGGTRGAGLGGLITVGGFAPAGIEISVTGAPWGEYATVTLTRITSPTSFTTNTITTERVVWGFAEHGPASNTSSAANVGGAIQLVTPIRVITTVREWGIFGTMTIQFTPEPGTAILFSSGLVVLGMARRRRGSAVR